MTKALPEHEIPSDFLCPITQQVFKDPVMDVQGHTYERNAIMSWLGRNGTCPMSRRPMKASDLIPNVMMQTRVRLWQRETGQKVTPAKRWDGMHGVLSGEDPTETESGSEGSDDVFGQSPVFAVTIVPASDRRQRSRRRSRSSRRRQHNHRNDHRADRPAEEPVTNSESGRRRFRLFSRRGSL